MHIPFDLHIKNIGKLPPDAKLSIGQFTVLAGPNNTGKSFVSKILYSLFGAMNENFPVAYLRSLIGPVQNAVEDLMMGERLAGRADTLLEELQGKINQMDILVAQISLDDSAKNENKRIIATLRGMTKQFSEDLNKIYSSADLSKNQGGNPDILTHHYFSELKKFLDLLQKVLSGLTAHRLVADGFGYIVEKNLIANFQILTSLDLLDNKDHAAKISVPRVCTLTLSKKGSHFSLEHAGLQIFRHFSNVLYLESPMHWKLKGALENFPYSLRHRHTRRKEITGVPGYFYDLTSKLRSQYTGEVAFPELYEKLTGKGVIDGKLTISDTGKISFHEKNRAFPLSVTATGVTNLGFLALLIERKILDKDSFLFIDEPEAHLHPAWQVVMAETLFELAKGGAHVVIATHSADILKWLEVHIKENPGDEELVALNQFHTDATGAEDACAGDMSFADKIAAIKKDLTQPFADLYMKGLKGL